MRRLSGRVAVVTGASRGIGLAVAQQLAVEAAPVCVTARDAAALDAAVAAAAAAFGPVDLLVNYAGINPSYGPLLSLDLGAAHQPLSGDADGITGQTLLVDGGIPPTRRGVT